MTEDALDPNFEWVEITSLDDPVPQFMRGECRHIETAPVITGCSWGPDEQVAVLCTNCDAAWDMEGEPLDGN